MTCYMEIVGKNCTFLFCPNGAVNRLNKLIASASLVRFWAWMMLLKQFIWWGYSEHSELEGGREERAREWIHFHTIPHFSAFSSQRAPLFQDLLNKSVTLTGKSHASSFSPHSKCNLEAVFLAYIMNWRCQVYKWNTKTQSLWFCFRYPKMNDSKKNGQKSKMLFG